MPAEPQQPDLSGDLSAEDAKLVTLARATRARARAAEGAAVRDLEVCVAMAISSASSGLEAAVVLGDGDVVDLAAVSDFAGADVPVLVGDATGRIHSRENTHA